MTVVSAAPITREHVEAALDEAGEYRIAVPGEEAVSAASRGRLPIVD